jgi:hypothetical protein
MSTTFLGRNSSPSGKSYTDYTVTTAQYTGRDDSELAASTHVDPSLELEERERAYANERRSQNDFASQLASTYAPLGYAPQFSARYINTGKGTHGFVPNRLTGFQRIETPQDRAINLLRELLGRWDNDGQLGKKPDLSPYSIPVEDAVNRDALAGMMNRALQDPMKQAASASRSAEQRMGARGMGHSPIADYIRASTEAQARSEGTSAANQLQYGAEITNAQHRLQERGVNADSWNQYQSALVGRYQAENSFRNALLGVIGALT